MSDLTPETLVYTVSAGMSVALGSWLLADTLLRAHAEAMRFQTERGAATSVLFKVLRPFARWFGFLVGGLAARIEMRLGRDVQQSFLLTTRIRIERKLRAAGHPEGVTADEFLGLVVVGVGFGALLGAVIYMRVEVMAAVFVGALVGGMWPNSWLNRCLRARQTDVRHELPYALDLLTLSVEAGLDFTEALTRIAQKLKNSPMATELGQMLRDIRLGRTRSVSLRNMAQRLDMPEITSVVSALIQADELGAALGPILRAQSEQLRTARSQEAEKRALEAPVKILFPLIFCILPTIFLIIGGPIFLRYRN